MNLSLRARLTLWFGLVMAVSLSVFGALTYTSISGQLRSGLDVALNNAVDGIVVTLQSKAEEAQEKDPPKRGSRHSVASVQVDTSQPEIEFLRNVDSARADSSSAMAPRTTQTSSQKAVPEPKSLENVGASITDYVVLNPRNFLVQVFDSTGAVVFRSASLGNDTLELKNDFLQGADTNVFLSTLNRVFTDKDNRQKERAIRVALAKFRSVVLVVAYPFDEVQSSLDDFLRTLMLLIPVVLLVSTIGGWFLARASLRPVDELTRTAQDITASNLSRRLPVAKSNDEIKRLSETLNDMISRLESSFGRIRQFTADASHELRTPLTILTGELELALRSARTEEEYQEVISSALQETLRMSRVVEDLLLLSRADMGHIRLQSEMINLNDILVDLADATSILGADKNLSISYRHEDQPIYVLGDHARLYQMFLNLLDNAVKYTPRDGSISLTLYRDGNVAEVRVRDTGIGISKEHQKKIFDRFYRVDKARSRAHGGVGLGLSIVEWTARAHDGVITVESEPGHGSTFIVRLPLAPELVKPEKESEERHDERHGIAGTFDLPKFLKRGKQEERESNGSTDEGVESEARDER